MKNQIIGTMCLIILFMVLPAIATDNNAPAPYMGQEPPGLVPKVFAPGLISLPNRGERDICFSKDWRECYFTVHDANWTVKTIMVTRYENGHWTKPVQASFANNASSCPSLADNDQSLYFVRDRQIWKVHRITEGWSQPEAVPAPISSSKGDWSCHISSLGNAWICSWRAGGAGQCDMWRVQSTNGQFTEATNLRSLNTSVSDCGPVPGPNENYVIWQSHRPGGFGSVDLYISFADGKGGWTAPKNLGPAINTSGIEAAPKLSSDYKYLFFSRCNTPKEGSEDEDIYWVSVEAFLQDPNKPVPDKHK